MKKGPCSFVISGFVALFPAIACAETLCAQSETDYFSCSTERGKVISVCGNIAGEIEDDSWLQYRYGKRSKLELAFPSKKTGSVSAFEGNFFSRYNVVDLRFISGKYAYGVQLVEEFENEEGEKQESSANVSVSTAKVGPPIFQDNCKQVDISKYYLPFSDLNMLLRKHNGDTDILYQFYKRNGQNE